MEYWKQIKGYPHLLVSRDGKVWTTKYNRYLRPFVTNRGYLRIGLNKDKVIKTVGVHRLVAEAFIPNPGNLPCVDHIDGNKLNNNVENLQWISTSENCRKAYKYADKPFTPIICIETGKVYRSKAHAARDLHISSAIMSSLLKGEFPVYHGLHFAYFDGEFGDVPKGYITPREYAAKHGLSINTVEQRIYKGTLPVIKITIDTVVRNFVKENEPWVELKRGRKA